MKHTILARCFSKHHGLGAAYNEYKKSHPLQAYFAKKVGHPERIYLHAEIAAILLSHTHKIERMEITRHRKNGKLALAKPCPICQEAIKAFGIKEVWYSTNEGTMERL